MFISAGIFPIPANKGGAVKIDRYFTENNAKEDRYEIYLLRAVCLREGK